MKIPTVLGLLLLTIAIALGVYLYYLSQTTTKLLQTTLAPHEARVVNLTPTSATITWQTDQPSIGQVIYGEGNALNMSQADDRDSLVYKPRLTHLATLKKLKPHTQYQFQIQSNSIVFPVQKATFTTLPSTQPMGELDLYQPVRGTILTSTGGETTPVDESLVFLRVVGATPLVTFTTAAGNFILPITTLYRLGTNQLVDLSQSVEAVLEIIRGEQKSEIEILLPLGKKSLPPLTLGQDLDLRKILSSPSAQVATPTSPLDLNSDGKINSLDLSIVLQNFGKSPKDEQSSTAFKRADLNSDGIVDLKDTELIKKALQ